jgi:hypothetical protein
MPNVCSSPPLSLSRAQESPEQFNLAVSSSLLAGALQVSITASAAVGQPFTFAADVELNFDFWDKVRCGPEMNSVTERATASSAKKVLAKIDLKFLMGLVPGFRAAISEHAVFPRTRSSCL